MISQLLIKLETNVVFLEVSLFHVRPYKSRLEKNPTQSKPAAVGFIRAKKSLTRFKIPMPCYRS